MNTLPSDKKVFIPIYLNKQRIMGCVDPGSDLTIMHDSLYARLAGIRTPLRKNEIKYVNTFSNTNIEVKGVLDCQVQLEPYAQGPGIQTSVYIIPDVPEQTPFLIGADFLREGKGGVLYDHTDTDECARALVIFNYPKPGFQCTVYETSPKDLFTCQAIGELEPAETATVEFYLPSAAPVIRTDYVLITSPSLGTITIIPSRDSIEFCHEREAYVAHALVTNCGRAPFKGEIKGKYEIINNYLALEVDRTNRGWLKTALVNYPLGREILPVESCSDFQIPIYATNKISPLHQTDIKVSDLDLADTVMAKEPTYSGEGVVSEEIIEPHGIDLPTVIYKDASEAIDLTKHKPEVQGHLKRIFLDKHPSAVALHAMDSGNFSLTLGYIKLRLREGETLPRSKRIFHVSPSDQRHLDDICEFLLKYGYIRKTPICPNGTHLYGLSAYLVPRAKPGTLGRLIVDFSPINPLIETPSSVIPEINSTLQMLQGRAMYTSLDLRYAFMGLKMDEESMALTTFLTPSGSWQWCSLPTGSSLSPCYFSDSMNRILHYAPVRDENGEVVYESPNVVRQVRDPLPSVTSYMDDILITSDLKATYGETLAEHFRLVEQAVDRLAFHGAKINVMKCEFSKSKILFLGWYISHDYVIADPRRIEKVRDFKFPTSKKTIRAFLGLVNSLRRVISMAVVEQVAILTPLTSSKNEFKTNEAHLKAFNEIKQMLIKEPLFGNLIDEKAEKYLFCDAATSTNVMGAVLLQKIRGNNEKIVPTCLDLDNEIHRMIFDKELPYEPAKLYTSLPITVAKPGTPKTRPPNVLPEEKYLGFSEKNIADSFFWSTISILSIYNCVLPADTLEYRKLAVKKLRKGTILNNKLKDFTFNLNYNNYKEFIEDFLEGKVGLDPDLYLAEALALALHRPMIFLSSLERHKNKPIFSFNPESEKPPLIYGIYERYGYEIFMPFFINKHVEFRLDSLKGKVQIIAYVSKTIPEAFKSRPIVDLEVFAILSTLYSLERFISGVPVQLLTDSRVLYYLFSSKVHNSSVKIKRWCLKLLSDYPLIKLHFIRTTENLADFLTREGLPPGDLERFNLRDINIRDFYSELPKHDFSLPEWIQYVDNHPEYLTINQYDHLSKPTVLAINRGIENLTSLSEPLNILKERLTRSEFIRNQKNQYGLIRRECIKSKNFEFTEEGPAPRTFFMLGDMLMIREEAEKIVVPQIMVGLLLSHTHLLGHKGLTRMLEELKSYYFPNKYTVTRNFIACCYSCFLSQTGNKRTKLGIYPTPTRAFQEVTMDLAENLNMGGKYQHLLITKCIFSDFTVINPLRTKKNDEISDRLRDGILQMGNIERLHSDNAAPFRERNWLIDMAAHGVTVINSSSLNPSSRGAAERTVQSVKLIFKRLLATQKDYNWKNLGWETAKILNTTISPKTGFRPAALVFGENDSAKSYLDREELAQPHHLVKNQRTHILETTESVKKAGEIARERLITLQLKTAAKLNQTRVNKGFQRGDYVFVKDRTEYPGATRPLRTKLSPSPYVVLKVLHTTVLVRRIADSFTSLYSMDDVKKYDSTSPLYAFLPKEIINVLLNDFQDLLTDDFCKITKYDPLVPPESIPLTTKYIVENSPPNVTNQPLEEENEEYLKNLEKEFILNDISDLAKSKNKHRLDGEESEEEEQEGENEDGEENKEGIWAGRLRNRNVKFSGT